MRGALALILAAGFFAACDTTPKPTRVRETPERKFDGGAQFLSPVKITPQTVVLDARTRFEYSTAHIPRSQNVQWQDFSDPQKPGVLLDDNEELTRRLARLGVSPSVPVVVVGQGFDGDDEEGRIAWMLAYLGVKQVQFAEMASLKPRLTNSSNETPAASAEYWKPAPIDSLNVTRGEFNWAIDQHANVDAAAFVEGAPKRVYRFLDVRSRRDDHSRPGLNTLSGVPRQMVAIPWREFFDAHMHILKSAGEKLRTAGLDPEMRVIVFSEDGVSSSGVTLALRALGYSHAGNLAEGVHDMFPGR